MVIEGEESLKIYLPEETAKETAKKLANLLGKRIHLEVYEPTKPNGTTASKKSNPIIDEELFLDKLQQLCERLEPAIPRGRPPKFIGDIVFFNIWRTRSGFTIREAAKILKAKNRVDLHFNTANRYMDSLVFTSLLRNLLHESADVFRSQETEFVHAISGFATPYGTKQKTRWLDIDLTVGIKTNVVFDVEIFRNGVRKSQAGEETQFLTESNALTQDILALRFGEAIRARTETSQINEILCHVIAHNLERQ